MFIGPRTIPPHGYPFDFDAGLRYTRPAPYVPFHPWPAGAGGGSSPYFGALAAFMPLQDTIYLTMAKAKTPTGPLVNAPLSDLFKFLTNTIPGLSKTGG